MLSYNKLIALTAIIAVLVLSSMVITERYFHSKIQETRIDQYSEQQSLIVLQIASSLKDFIEHLKLELISSSQSTPEETLYQDTDPFSDYHKSLTNSIDAVVRLDSSGNVVYATGEIEIGQEEFSPSDIYKVPRQSSISYVTETNIDNSSYLAVAVPVFTDEFSAMASNNFDGVMFALLDMEEIEDSYLDQFRIGVDGYIWAVRQDGVLLTDQEVWKGLSSGDDYFSWVKNLYPQNSDNVNRMIVEDSGAFIDDWGDHGRTISSYHHLVLGSERWIVVSTTPYEEVEAGIMDMQKRLVYFLLFIVFLFSLLFIFILFVLKSKEHTEKQLERAEETLQKLGIEAIPERTESGDLDVDLMPNHIYLVKHSYDRPAMELFINVLSRGYSGLGITREDPDVTKETYGLERTPFLWLRQDDDVHSVSDIEDIERIVSEFLLHEKTVVLIERLDYVILQNGFKETIQSIHNIRDKLTKDNILILALDPSTVDRKQLNIIEQETKDISSVLGQPRISQDLYDMLSYIHNQNNLHKKVYFKHISKNFDLSKPTTKKKLEELEHMDLVEIHEQGRVKTLSVTSRGEQYLKE